VTALRK